MPDIKSAVVTFRQRGLMVSDPNGPSAFTGGILANITDPNAGGIELERAAAGWQASEGDGKLEIVDVLYRRAFPPPFPS